MNIQVACPHCQREVSAPAGVQSFCQLCGNQIIAQQPASLPRSQIIMLLLLVPVAAGMFWLTRTPTHAAPASHADGSAPSIAAPAPSGAQWMEHGRRAYKRLQDEGKTIRMSTIHTRQYGDACSLVLVKGTWAQLTTDEQQGLAALLEDYAKDKPWKLYDGGDVMRASAR